MRASTPLTKDLVLIGGGHAHALLLRGWAMEPLPGARITLISPEPTTPYTGMLPGHIAGHYTQAELEIDLVRLARRAGARLALGAATGVDRTTRRVRLVDLDGAPRPDIAYDALSVDIGITSAMPDLPGFTQHGRPAKPLGPFAAQWEAFLTRVPALGRPPRAAVIGGGVAGVELAMAMAHRLRHLTGPMEVQADTPAELQAEITVLEAGETPLPDLGAAARARLLQHLERLGVTLRTGAEAAELAAHDVALTTGDSIASDFTVGAAGATPHPWLTETGLALTNGFIDVGPTLQSTLDPEIFAVGDCAHMTHAPRPKAGVFAVRQAPVLLYNLKAALSGGRLSRYHPQRDYLKLISTGDRNAVADKFGLAFNGAWLWRSKDRIDRRFMAHFTGPSDMPAPEIPRPAALGVRERIEGAGPLCGGCGAKAGANALKLALTQLPTAQRADVLSRPGDDAAILGINGSAPQQAAQVITTDHLRAFTDDPWMMAKITAVHALGDVWAMGARPQAALATVILPEMSELMQAETLREILDGAGAVLRKAGADLVGGHTSLGAETTIGFTITGLLDGPALTLAGAQPGDALLLSKPIGVGVLLAAEMRQQAPGAEVVAAYRAMLRPQIEVSILLSAQARAMTDVTGFGLAGHLLNILEASGVGAQIRLEAVPLLEGAAALSAEGVRSSLWTSNRDAAMERLIGDLDSPLAELLFDPQTAGGLLAAVPAESADALRKQLHSLGFPAAIIGEVLKPPARGEARLQLV
ncbi:MAG: selenide, water dikinase SelD [Rhodobacteraceae bacterium]|nr:selenide, water dikinase SelD [Paracoccaceae bacterium]